MKHTLQRIFCALILLFGGLTISAGDDIRIALSADEVNEVVRASTPYLFIGSELSPLSSVITKIAPLATAEENVDALKTLATRFAQNNKTAQQNIVKQALEEASLVLNKHHNAITDDEELRTIAANLDECKDLIGQDALLISVQTDSELRAPRPSLQPGGYTGSTGTQYNPEETVNLPRDVNIERDLNVGNNLTVGGIIIFVGPATFHNNIILEPIAPATDIAIHFNDNAGNLITQFSSQPGAPTNGLVVIENGSTYIHHTGPSPDTNIFVGSAAGNLTVTGGENSGFGVGSLIALTSGVNNTAVGRRSLQSLLSGNSNTAVGYAAGKKITTGNNNTIVGYNAGSELLTGASNNVLLGYNAGLAYTNVESNNICIGKDVVGVIGENSTIRIGAGHTDTYIAGGNLHLNDAVVITEGAVNDPYIHQTGPSPITNIFVGNNAGNLTVIGGENSGFGVGSLIALTSGSNNTAVGRRSLQGLLSGGSNTALGYAAGRKITTGNNNTIVGYNAGSELLSGASNNVLLGYNAGLAYTNVESNNICIGMNALGVATENNTIRIGAGHNDTYITGINGVNVGASGNLVGITTGHKLGTTATTWNFTGNLNLDAATVITENGSLPYIHHSGPTSPTTNMFVGSNAGNLTVTGGSNSGFGTGALVVISSGASNTAIGRDAGVALTTGNNNTLVGHLAGNAMNGSNNVLLGYNTGTAYTGVESNNICIGKDVVGVLGENDTIRLGAAAHTATYITGINSVNVGASGNLVGITTGHKLGTTATTWTLTGNLSIGGNYVPTVPLAAAATPIIQYARVLAGTPPSVTTSSNGMTAARNGAGDYTVTYGTAYTSIPVAVATVSMNAATPRFAICTPTTTTCQVKVFDDLGGAQDLDFSLLLIA